MPVTIETRYDSERGCGWRCEGGLYLVADGPAAACGRMPLPLTVCGCCGHGLKASRGWTWVAMPAMLLHEEPRDCHEAHCAVCPLNPVREDERMGLLWIGEAFYKTPHDWIREAHAQGISRRISALPKGLVLGQTWCLIAHRKAVQGVDDGGDIAYNPGIIQAFRPKAIEYVVHGNETEEQLAAMAKRGITPIRVERRNEQQMLLGTDQAAQEPAAVAETVASGQLDV